MFGLLHMARHEVNLTNLFSLALVTVGNDGGCTPHFQHSYSPVPCIKLLTRQSPMTKLLPRTKI